MDFGYCSNMFGELTFGGPHDPASAPGKPALHTHSPTELLHHMHEELQLKFGGIRKPRTFSNINHSIASGWLLPGADSNTNWNFSAPGFTEWYVRNHLHFLHEGVDFWWNDEGETSWENYFLWNIAQRAITDAVAPAKRSWTLNRAFVPDMLPQRGWVISPTARTAMHSSSRWASSSTARVT